MPFLPLTACLAAGLLFWVPHNMIQGHAFPLIKLRPGSKKHIVCYWPCIAAYLPRCHDVLASLSKCPATLLVPPTTPISRSGAGNSANTTMYCTARLVCVQNKLMASTHFSSCSPFSVLQLLPVPPWPRPHAAQVPLLLPVLSLPPSCQTCAGGAATP